VCERRSSPPLSIVEKVGLEAYSLHMHMKPPWGGSPGGATWKEEAVGAS
jgi:hypothetical protein